MKKIWDWAIPYVFAVGGHVVLLGLLLLSFSPQLRPAHRGVADGGAMVEATLVSALPPSEAVPAESARVQPPPAEPQPRQPVALPVPQPEPDTSTRNDTPVPPEKIVAEPQPQESDTQRNPVDVAPGVPASQPGNGNPQGLPEGESADATDPYAQMRRQRAEAERQYQLEAAESLKWPHLRQAPVADAAETATPRANVAPSPPQVGSGGADLQGTDLFATGHPWNSENDWPRFDLPPSTHCPFADSHPGNEDGMTEAWIDCVLNSTLQDAAGTP